MTAPAVRKLAILAAWLLVCATVLAAPGDILRTVNLGRTGLGVSVGVDCDGVVYYTREADATLYKMDARGNELAAVPIRDSVTSQPLQLDELSWDPTRGVFWSPRQGSNPLQVYQLDPVTGVATLAFVGWPMPGGWVDGLAYDRDDDSVWASSDISKTIEHYRADGTFLNQLTPLNSGGAELGSISGVFAGVGDILFLGQSGRARIAIVKKSTGEFLRLFASPGGTHDEGLECDMVNFAPKLAMWSRDLATSRIVAMEVEPETCSCGGGGCPSTSPVDAVAGADGEVCAGASFRLDGIASLACDAAGLLFQWSAGGLPECPWSPASVCDVSPAVTTTYRLEVQCQAQLSCIDADEVVLTVLPQPFALLAPAGPLCAGEPLTLDASASLPNGCTEPLQYQFRQGATLLQAFSPDATYGPFVPAGSAGYDVEVRCGSSNTCVNGNSQVVEVEAAPVPVDLGNTLRAVRSDARVSISVVWVPGARTFNLYRGTQKGVWPAALFTGLTGTTATLDDVPPPPALYFYRLTATNCQGVEGP